jgi:hypothetical protein
MTAMSHSAMKGRPVEKALNSSEVKQLAILRIWTTSVRCGGGAAGTTFRVLAAPLSGANQNITPPVVLGQRAGAPTSTKLLVVMRLGLHEWCGSARPQGTTPSCVWKELFRSVSELRRHLKVDDASPYPEACEQLLAQSL